MNPLLNSFVQDYRDIKTLLLNQSELSFQATIDTHFKKTFLISCASYHETHIQNTLHSFLEKASSDSRMVAFANSKGIKRQYHTYFVWESSNGKTPNNINNFLGLFGIEFKEKIATEISSDSELLSNMKAFLEIGNLRNQMAHQNLLTFNLEKTFDELVVLNEKALSFLMYLDTKFS